MDDAIASTAERGHERELREPVRDQLLYGVDQAAQILGISSKLVRVYIDRGELRTRKCGTRVLVHRRELERFSLRDHEGVGGVKV